MKLKVLQYQILKCEITPKNTYAHTRARGQKSFLFLIYLHQHVLITSKVLPRVPLNLISLFLSTTSENIFISNSITKRMYIMSNVISTIAYCKHILRYHKPLPIWCLVLNSNLSAIRRFFPRANLQRFLQLFIYFFFYVTKQTKQEYE